MTAEEFYNNGLFNLDFMTEEERQTIYQATELYAKGKVRQASPVPGKEESQCIIKQNGGKECPELCDLCFERYKSILFEQESGLDINGLIRSFHSIIERKGADTNWEAIGKKVDHVLKIQHKQMYPSQYPSTASNEDKFVWTDELVKNYAEGYRFSSSRLSIKKFKESKWLSQESVERNYKLAIEEVEPKAVQQAAKEYAGSKGYKDEPAQYDGMKLFDLVSNAFLAGASFNSDAVDQDELWKEIGKKIMDGYDSSATEHQMTEYLKSKYTISLKNNIQQAHDKSTYE